MNWRIGFFVAIVLLGVAAAYFFGAKASSPKYGYVLNQQVFEGFEGRKILAERLSRLQASHQHTLDSLQSLTASGNVEALRFLYDKKSVEFANEEKTVSTTYTADVWKEINRLVSAYGKDNGFDFIFGANGSGTVMYANETRDVTLEVIDYLNKKYEKE